MIANKWLSMLLGLGIGALLGYFNYRLIIKNIVTASDPKAAIRKGSVLRFFLIFLGLYLAIRLGGFTALAIAAVSMLLLTCAFLFKLAKGLSKDDASCGKQ